MPKSPMHYFWVVCFGLILGFAYVAPNAQAASVHLRLIAFNDFHGNLEPGSNELQLSLPDDPKHTVAVPTGGAAWLGGLIRQLRAEAPNSVVFSSGDLIGAAPLVSTLFRHESTIAVMNAIGLDFGVVGNHEFDAGKTELERLVRGGCVPNTPDVPITSCALSTFEGLKFPLLAANVEGADGRPIFTPTYTKEFGGIKVGFIGVVTRTAPSMVRLSGIKGLTFRDEAGTLNRYARALKRQGVEAIVAVVHEGGVVKTQWNDLHCAGKTGRIFKIANKLSRDIDLVFSAHTHQGYNCVINTPHQEGLRIVQATSFGRGVSVIDVELDSRTHDIDRRRTNSRNIPVVNTTKEQFAPVPNDPAITKLVGDYVTLDASKADRLVGSIQKAVSRGLAEGTGDSPAGRMVADAQLAATHDKQVGNAQIAFTNAGGIRTALACASTPPCKITYGQAFTMQPFGNNLVVMTLTGRQLKALLEEQQKPGASEASFLQPSRGVSYTWKRQAQLNNHVSNLKLDGVLVQPNSRYRVTVSSFLAEGGDRFQCLKEGKEQVVGPLDVDALVEFLKSHPAYNVDPQPRITLID
jgi:5'-nucleotidase